MPRFIVLCREVNEEPPGVIFRTVDASDEVVAGRKVEAYHDVLPSGSFSVIGVHTPAEIIQIGLDAMEAKTPDIP